VLFALLLAAGGLNVTPVQIHLSKEESKALLTLRNDSPDATRYQLSVNAWDEDPRAGMKLRIHRLAVAEIDREVGYTNHGKQVSDASWKTRSMERSR
jgi:hypothetical protein